MTFEVNQEDLLNLITTGQSIYESTAEVDEYQFGFKPGHSTSLCTSVFKQTVDYYRNRGSHVFALDTGV